MCDFTPGQVIFGSPIGGIGSEVGSIVRSRLPDTRTDAGLHPLADQAPAALEFPLREGFPYRLERLEVQPGRELEVVAEIQDIIIEETARQAARTPTAVNDLLRAGQRVIAQPMHHVHPLDAAATADPFSFGELHWNFLDQINQQSIDECSCASLVAVLDGGFDLSRIDDDRFDRSTESRFRELVDLTGEDFEVPTAAATHGTLVAALVASVCSAEILPLRVFGRGGAATEWTLLHGLQQALVAKADVINISMGFGLDDHECIECGTLTQVSRSAALELVIKEAIGSTGNGPNVVGAAGNGALGWLVYPAQIHSTVAISSVNSLGAPSTHSNFDLSGTHPWLFGAPGGDERAECNEWPAKSAGHTYRGTSFAAAYASGLLARLNCREAPESGAEALERLQSLATEIDVADHRYMRRGALMWP